MAKVNRINEICRAIAETREILASSSFQSPLLQQHLEKEELRLLNELYDEVWKKPSTTKRNRTMAKHNLNQGGKNENG